MFASGKPEEGKVGDDKEDTRKSGRHQKRACVSIGNRNSPKNDAKGNAGDNEVDDAQGPGGD